MKTVFTYAHVKWFYGQSERVYYLNYFIVIYSNPASDIVRSVVRWTTAYYQNNKIKCSFHSLRRKKFRPNSLRNCSVCVRVTFDEMKSSFARFIRRGLVVEVECDIAVSEGIHQILRFRAHHVWNYCI